MTQVFAPLAAALLAAGVLAGAGASVADPRDYRDEGRREAPREPRGGGVERPFEGRPWGAPYVPRPPAARPNYPGSDWREQQDEARSGVNEGRLAPLGRVIEGIGRRTPGRQLDSGITYMGGRAVYRVRWMTRDGRLIDYVVDAATGTIMGEH